MNSTAATTNLPTCDACAPTRSEDQLVCSCFQVYESIVKHAVDSGAASVESVTKSCGAGGGCTACHVRIERVLRGMPAKCGSGRFDLCGGCGCIGLLCSCESEETKKDQAAA